MTSRETILATPYADWIAYDSLGHTLCLLDVTGLVTRYVPIQL